MITFYFNIDPKTRDEVIASIYIFEGAYEHDYNQLASSTFGHVVIGDNNLEDHFIKGCLTWNAITDWYDHALEYQNADSETLDVQRDDIIMFLRWLETVDENIRCGEGDE